MSTMVSNTAAQTQGDAAPKKFDPVLNEITGINSKMEEIADKLAKERYPFEKRKQVLSVFQNYANIYNTIWNSINLRVQKDMDPPLLERFVTEFFNNYQEILAEAENNLIIAMQRFGMANGLVVSADMQEMMQRIQLPFLEKTVWKHIENVMNGLDKFSHVNYTKNIRNAPAPQAHPAAAVKFNEAVDGALYRYYTSNDNMTLYKPVDNKEEKGGNDAALQKFLAPERSKFRNLRIQRVFDKEHRRRDDGISIDTTPFQSAVVKVLKGDHAALSVAGLSDQEKNSLLFKSIVKYMRVVKHGLAPEAVSNALQTLQATAKTCSPEFLDHLIEINRKHPNSELAATINEELVRAKGMLVTENHWGKPAEPRGMDAKENAAAPAPGSAAASAPAPGRNLEALRRPPITPATESPKAKRVIFM